MFVVMKDTYVAAVLKTSNGLKAAITKYARHWSNFSIVAHKEIKTFPCYIVERKFAKEFTFHQRKPRIKRKKTRSGMPIIYTIRKEFCNKDDQMGALDHDHLGGER